MSRLLECPDRIRNRPGPSRTERGLGIDDLRDVLGDQTYESLARKGETMTTAVMSPPDAVVGG